MHWPSVPLICINRSWVMAYQLVGQLHAKSVVYLRKSINACHTWSRSPLGDSCAPGSLLLATFLFGVSSSEHCPHLQVRIWMASQIETASPPSRLLRRFVYRTPCSVSVSHLKTRRPRVVHPPQQAGANLLTLQNTVCKLWCWRVAVHCFQKKKATSPNEQWNLIVTQQQSCHQVIRHQ